MTATAGAPDTAPSPSAGLRRLSHAILGGGAPSERIGAAHLVRGCALAAIMTLLWGPIFGHPGIVFTRDPAFFSTVHADVSYSLGVTSLQGGASNLANQGLFYEPYSLLTMVLGWAGLTAANVSKLIIGAVSMAGTVGCYTMLRQLKVSPWAAIVATSVFILNPWSLDQFGYFFIWTGYCLLPFVVVGTIRTFDRRRPSLTFFCALLFSGGLVSWVVAALAVTIVSAVCVATAASPRPKKSVAWLLVAFGAAGAFWILPYGAWAAQQGRNAHSHFATITAGLLQSVNPVADLLALRNFWWPHLQPVSVVGLTATAASTLATTVLVVSAIAWSAFVWPAASKQHGARMRGVASLLMLGGVALAAGTAGPTGWLYAVMHDVPIPGHVFVAALTRSPANFTGLFVLGFVMALAAALCWIAQLRAGSRRSAFGIVCMAAAIACAPSVLAFWQQYRPITPPSYYARAAAVLPPGVVLELGLWHDVVISPRDGVAHYSWSSRMVADPTLLTAYVPAPSLTPELVGLADVGARILPLVRPSGLRQLRTMANALHIRTLVVENDLVRGQGASGAALLNSLRAAGLLVRVVGGVYVVQLHDVYEPAYWARRCAVGSVFAAFGAYSVSCHGSLTRRTLYSDFSVPVPVFGLGLHVGGDRQIYGSLGTEIAVTGTSGWIVSLPGALAGLGLMFTSLSLLVGASVRVGPGLRRVESCRGTVTKAVRKRF